MSYEPTTERMKSLRSQLPDECWQKRVQVALQRLAVVLALLARCPDKRRPGRGDVASLAEPEDRTNAMRWWDWYHSRDGEPWERLMDRRLPPKPWHTPESWHLLVQGLGRQDPPPTWEQIRATLVKQFGPDAALGETKIRAILAEAGLEPGSSRPAKPVEEVTELHGGGLLVLLLAAVEQTGALHSMAQKIQLLVRVLESPEQVEEEPAGRDELGRLTAEYNRNVAARLQAEGRTVFRSIEESGRGKDLTQLRVSQLSVETLEQHLRCLTALPLVTERRGTVGLDDPAGAWLEVFSGVPYLSSTMNKTLAGLKHLQLGGMMWESHAKTWLAWSAKWSGGQGWRTVAAYVDATKDPWWTERFAKAGKVSVTGRVQPCLERTVLTAGPGVPLYCEVRSGTGPLGEQVRAILARFDVVLGRGAVGRLTIVDAECCVLDLLREYNNDPERDIITMFKGPLAKGKTLEPKGDWQPYRQHDLLREVEVALEPGKPDGLRLRGVEMTRPDGRRPRSCCFLTTAKPETLSTQEVADAQLSRWPAQEQVFRRGRSGLGLNRTSGFGVYRVTNIAIVEKRAAAARRLDRANKQVELADSTAADALRQLEAAKDNRSEQDTAPIQQAAKRVADATRLAKLARKAQAAAAKKHQELVTTPTEIFVRDTALDQIATCLKMVLLCLLEFVCQEYLGRRRLDPQTIVGAWMPLPVTIRKSKHRVIYEVAPNPRNQAATELLRSALAEVTARRLKVDGRLMIACIKGELPERRESS